MRLLLSFDENSSIIGFDTMYSPSGDVGLEKNDVHRWPYVACECFKREKLPNYEKMMPVKDKKPAEGEVLY